MPHVGSRRGYISSSWSGSSGGSSGLGGRASISSISSINSSIRISNDVENRCCRSGGCFYTGHLPVGVYLPNYGAVVGRMMRRVGMHLNRKRLLTPHQLVASLLDRQVFEDSRSASIYHHEHHPDHHPHSSVPEQRVASTPECEFTCGPDLF